jgi:predicted permease
MSFWSRLRQTLLPNQRNREIAEEAQGLSPDEARRQARQRFGAHARIVEETREVHLFQWLDTWRRDSAYAIKGLLRRPAFLTTGLLTLSLGIGVNVAIFSLLDGLLLKPLPVPAADRLMAFVETRNGQPTGGNPVRLREYGESMRSLQSIGGFYSETIVTNSGDGPLPLRTIRTVGHLVQTFGYQPILGRIPGAGEENVALLGHRFWERHYGKSRDVLGKSLKTESGAIEIIGVLGADSSLIENYDLWLPAGRDTLDAPRTAGFLMVVTRLKPNVELATANAELATVNRDAAEGLKAQLKPFGAILSNEASTPVYLLSGVVFTILLIACANLAGLLLARNAERTREAAIRAAIGASRWDLVRLYLLESVWLAIPGGALGLLTGAWCLALIKAFIPENLPLLATIAVDARAAAFACLLTIFCALAIGLLPAWQAARLKAGPSPLRSALVVAQVAVSMVLLMTAGLLLHSLLNAKRRPLGFQPDHVIAIQFEFPWDTPKPKLHRFYRDVEDAVRAVPGVRAAGLVDRLPLEGESQGLSYVRIRGRQLDDALARQSYSYRAISNGYITALRVPLLAGSLPDEKQQQTLVNETFAKRYFGDRSPVGEQISFAGAKREPVWYTITGVVQNVAQSAVDLRTFSEVYVPFERTYWPHSALVVHLEGDPAAAIAAAKRVDPFALIRYSGPLDARLEKAWAEPNLLANLLAGLALAALALVCVGIYGMLAGFVRVRTRDFGIRLALGATPASLMQLSLTHGLRLTASGLGLGLLATWPVARFLDKAPDPVAISVAAALMMAAAGAACYGPARRAAKLDPAMVLRHD